MPCISCHLINKFLLRNFGILEWIIFTTLIQNEVVCCFSLIGTCLMVERMEKSPKKIFLKFMLRTEWRLSVNCSLFLSLYHIEVVCWEAVFCIWRWTKIYFNKNKQVTNNQKILTILKLLFWSVHLLDMETVSLNKMIYTFWIKFMEFESWVVEDGGDFLNPWRIKPS